MNMLDMATFMKLIDTYLPTEMCVAMANKSKKQEVDCIQAYTEEPNRVRFIVLFKNGEQFSVVFSLSQVIDFMMTKQPQKIPF